MDTTKDIARISPITNVLLVANISLELLDDDGNVLECQSGHNIVVDDGIEWMTFGVWAGLSGIPASAALAETQFAILLGTGLTDNSVFIPVRGDSALKGSTSAKMDVTVPAALPPNFQMTFSGVVDAVDIDFHVREMGLGVVEAGGVQVTDSVNYRMLNIASGPPNRDYAPVDTGVIRGSVAFRLVSA